MSSFDRRTLLLMPLAIAACGFQPVYAPGGAGSNLYGKVAVSAPNTVDSYLLVQNLEQRLGRSATSGSDYNLDVQVSAVVRGAAITPTGMPRFANCSIACRRRIGRDVRGSMTPVISGFKLVIDIETLTRL